jgi:hypothetical protein
MRHAFKFHAQPMGGDLAMYVSLEGFLLVELIYHTRVFA